MTRIINESSSNFTTVIANNGSTFKNLAVIGICPIIICNNIEPTTVIIINGLSKSDSLNTDFF